MSVCAAILVRYMKKRGIHSEGSKNVEIISSLRLTARDIFFVVHCGPDVVAFTLGPQGVCLMGKWSYYDWTESQTEESS
ncbi:MAG: hypothetical protein IJP89_09245 [Synergistaceae bacterium]|nr:hypothetical protein [Synergistaceae bacterium]